MYQLSLLGIFNWLLTINQPIVFIDFLQINVLRLQVPLLYLCCTVSVLKANLHGTKFATNRISHASFIYKAKCRNNGTGITDCLKS